MGSELQHLGAVQYPPQLRARQLKRPGKVLSARRTKRRPSLAQPHTPLSGADDIVGACRRYKARRLLRSLP
jgi:hypothetical protein